MQRVKRIAVLFLIVLLIFSVASSFAAEEKKKSKDAAKPDSDYMALDRMLGFHRFIRPYSFPMALTSTNIGVTLGYLYSTIKYPDKLDFLIFKENYFQFGGLDETFNFEYEFVDHFSTEFILSGRVVTGIDERSALVLGGMGVYSASVIPKVNVFRKQSWGTALTLAAQGTYDQGAQTSPFLLLAQVINNAMELLNEAAQGNVPSESDLKDLVKIKLKESVTTMENGSVTPMVLAAQKITPALGVQAALGYEYGLVEKWDTPGVEDDTGDPPTAILAGAMGTLDFNSFSKLAMGARLELDYSKETNDDETSTTTMVGGGIYYTGKRDIDLGLTVFSMNSESSPEDTKGQDYLLFLNMRYFF